MSNLRVNRSERRRGRNGEARAIVREVEVHVRSERDDTEWVQTHVRVRRVVVQLDVLHVDALLDRRHLVDLARVLWTYTIMLR